MGARLESWALVAGLDVLLVVSFYIAFSGGLFSLASVGAMAVGAYAAAITVPELGVVGALVFGVACAAAMAALVGPFLLRIQGVYLAMATLALNEGIRILAIGLRDLTGGISGRFSSQRYIEMTHVVVSAVVMVILVWYLVDRTRLGLRNRVIREDPDLAASTGLNVKAYHYGAFIASSAVAGLAGGLKALSSFSLVPDEFSFRALIDGLAPVVIGGLSSVIAPVLAGLSLAALVEYLRAWQEYEPIIYGTVVIVFYIALPRGVGSRWSWVQLWWRVGGRRTGQEVGANEITRRAAVQQALEALHERPVRGHSGETLLQVRNLSRSFGGLRAVNDVSFELKRGEILGLVGPNGAGKTTLINAIAGVHPPQAGEVYLVDGTNVAGQPVHRIARSGVRRVFQGSRIIESLGPTQNMLGADQVGRLLDKMPGRRERPINVRNFSYGAKRWLEIARAIRAEGDIYIFDEPTTGLPREGVEEFSDIARQLADRSAGVLLVEHNVALIRSVCDRVIVLDFGEKIAEGQPDEVFGQELVRQAYLGEVDAT